jgi:hypothetical protein
MVLRTAASAVLLLSLGISPAWALSRDAQEFMDISAKLEPLQCERRKLALAQAESRDSAALRARFAALDRDPGTARLEKRLAELQPRISRSSDPEDLAAISRQHTEAFYRCE